MTTRPPRSRGPRPRADLDRITRAAIRLADEGGTGAVTLKRLGAELGLSPMGLYRYVDSKDELVALMVEAAVGPAPDLAAVPGDWRRKLELYARRVAATWPPHPWLPWLATGHRSVGPNEAGWLEAPLGVLEGVGLSGRDGIHAVLLIAGHVRNAHMTSSAGTQPSHDTGRLGDRMSAVLLEHGDAYPALARALRDPSGPPCEVRRREYGLDRVLDGLAVVVDRVRPAGGSRKAV
ncbi:TetR/AcrR family transcriptional regulator [Yinghuangia seranimata]|uniref:TetR/AcrR family transcriptional regulator n=1 Tax=Yinghuangia seranimata TaxID=408067 RepID=UPI00248B30AB|nr:TetR/AcrR family transcriptional regulator [Yinghuangia seranimata]MDI2125222.1 TetR/AcrR family transcriptional regulator [Yinghuangia seranimata]